jgi:chondroitin sulfate N-acetylgalactosaminyltransferase 1/2
MNFAFSGSAICVYTAFTRIVTIIQFHTHIYVYIYSFSFHFAHIFTDNPSLSEQQLLSFNSNSSTSSQQPQQQSSASYQLDCTNYIRRQVGNAEILHGLPMNNEYELIPFNHFTFSRVYPIDLGLGKRVVEKPIGYKRKDLLDALNRALDSLNKNATLPNQRYTLDDFIEGIYRNEPTTGTQYELYFRTKEINNKTSGPSPSLSSHHNDHGTTKIIVMRPFAPLQTIQIEKFPKTAEKEIIHIILPLSGRISTFQGFMDKFVKIALKNDRRVQLTVVYFGEEGLSEARQIMKRIVAQKSAYSSNLKLLALNETFSRGKL